MSVTSFTATLREHIVGILIAVAFGAWSLALFGTQSVIRQYLETQTRIEQKLAVIETTVQEGFAKRDRELEIIKERQNVNIGARLDQEMRIRNLEREAAGHISAAPR